MDGQLDAGIEYLGLVMLSGSGNIYIFLPPGAGGREASLFTAEMFHMYQK